MSKLLDLYLRAMESAGFVTRQIYKQRRTAALAEWRALAA
jgi:DNA-binding HxlR family transcriptional regulator